MANAPSSRDPKLGATLEAACYTLADVFLDAQGFLTHENVDQDIPGYLLTLAVGAEWMPFPTPPEPDDDTVELGEYTVTRAFRDGFVEKFADPLSELREMADRTNADAVKAEIEDIRTFFVDEGVLPSDQQVTAQSPDLGAQSAIATQDFRSGAPPQKKATVDNRKRKSERVKREWETHYPDGTETPKGIIDRRRIHGLHLEWAAFAKRVEGEWIRRESQRRKEVGLEATDKLGFSVALLMAMRRGHTPGQLRLEAVAAALSDAKEKISWTMLQWRHPLPGE